MRSSVYRFFPFVFAAFLAFRGAFAAEPASFDAAMVAKLESSLRECNAPGQEPKPKMAAFVKYFEGRGLKDAKIECGVSHYGETMPSLKILTADGAEYFVNFKKKGARHVVGDILADLPTAYGNKRHVLWPIPNASPRKSGSEKRPSP